MTAEACFSSTVPGISQTTCPNGTDQQLGAGAAAPCSLGDCLHGFCLGDLLGFQASAVRHVEEIGIAAGIELVRAIEHSAALGEQIGQHAMDNGGADLRLDVVADDRHAGGAETLGPGGIAGDEDGDVVVEGDASSAHSA